MTKKVELNHVPVSKSVNNKPKQLRIEYLSQYILPSDNHDFIGRIYDLSISSLHFESYEDLAQHADCKYIYHVNESLSSLTRRVESLNLVGNILWPEIKPNDAENFPVSRYEWLIIASDVFLMRYISVVDCAMLLVNEIYETSIGVRDCSIKNLKKKKVNARVIKILEELLSDQGDLRQERNSRFHHGKERGFTQDDTIFRLADLLEYRGGGVKGKDSFGRKINVERSFIEGLVKLQEEFNERTEKLVLQLDRLYCELNEEFETRFSPKFRSATHGYGVRG